MIQAVIPFLNFDGTAGEAIALYESALGATVESVMRWSDMQGEDIPPAMANNVMYGRLLIGDGAIELSDLPPHMQATAGTNFSVALHCTDPAELDRMAGELAAGGHVDMEPQDMFWGARYAKVTDRFGIAWSFNCPLEQG